jgi:uncharacterized protein YyaL (SSP411 family)
MRILFLIYPETSVFFITNYFPKEKRTTFVVLKSLFRKFTDVLITSAVG